MATDASHSPLARKSADWSHRPDMTSQPTELEVVLLGAPRVGKTAIAEQFLYKQFRETYKETVEEFHWIEYECDDSRTFMLKLIDTSGSHEFLAMRNLYIQKGHAFVLVWSEDVENSFEEVKHLRNAIKECNLKNSPVIIVTNKTDLMDDKKNKRQTPKEDVQIFAMETNCTAMEVSAKEYDSVEKIFRQLLHKSPQGSSVPERLKKRRQSMPANVESAQKNNKGRSPLFPAPDEHQKNGCIIS